MRWETPCTAQGRPPGAGRRANRNQAAAGSLRQQNSRYAGVSCEQDHVLHRQPGAGVGARRTRRRSEAVCRSIQGGRSQHLNNDAVIVKSEMGSSPSMIPALTTKPASAAKNIWLHARRKQQKNRLGSANSVGTTCLAPAPSEAADAWQRCASYRPQGTFWEPAASMPRAERGCR